MAIDGGSMIESQLFEGVIDFFRMRLGFPYQIAGVGPMEFS